MKNQRKKNRKNEEKNEEKLISFSDPHVFDTTLATLFSSVDSTAILHAGRLSLDKKKTVVFQYKDEHQEAPSGMAVE